MKKKDPLLSYGFSLENTEVHNSDIISSLMILLEEVLNVLKDKNLPSPFERDYIKDFVESKFIFIRCIGLKMLRISDKFTSDEKCTLLLDNESLYSNINIREQVYLLVAKIFNELSDDNRNKIVGKISLGPEVNCDKDNAENYNYMKYNWCIWLEKNNIKNNELNLLKYGILNSNPNFKPRINHEKDEIFNWVEWSEEVSPKTVEELKEMDSSDLIDYIKNYNDNNSFKISNLKLYDTFCACLGGDFEWDYKIVIGLLKAVNENKVLWDRVLIKLSKCKYSFEQHFKLMRLFICDKTLLNNSDLSVAWYIDKVLKNKDYSFEIKENTNELFGIVRKVIDIGKTIMNHEDICMKSVNSSFGVMVSTVITLLILDECDKKKYFDYFEELLKDKGSDKYDQVVFLLGGNLNTFYYYEVEWCKHNIIPLLTSSKEVEFVNSWEGVAYYSPVLSEVIAIELKDKYIDCIYRADMLKSVGRKILIKHFTLTMIYVSENPLIDNIPMFLKNSSEEDIIHFIETIKDQLRSMECDERHKFWNKWLEKYWKNRISSIPIKLEEYELKYMMEWCLCLEDIFPTAIRIIENGKVPNKVNEYYMYRLTTSNLMKQYPSDVVRLIIHLLNNGTNFTELSINYMNEIYELDISKELHDELEEALLKRRIIVG